MKIESMDKLKELMVSTYKKFGNEKMIHRGKDSYTGNEIAEEIENETEFGIKMVNNLIQLSIDLLRRDKVSEENKTDL